MHQDKKTAELEEIKELKKELNFETEVAAEEETEQEKFETIEEEIETGEVLEKRKRKEAIFEMALFLVLGILIGMTIKTEAIKRITIGFNDYQIATQSQHYDVSAMKKKLDDQMTAQQKAASQQQTGVQQQGTGN